MRKEKELKPENRRLSVSVITEDGQPGPASMLAGSEGSAVFGSGRSMNNGAGLTL